jgi:hypothetical protein
MLKRCLIYSLILIFGLPFGAIAFGADKASASEKKVSVSKAEFSKKTTSEPEKAIVQKDITSPLPPKIEGFAQDRVYLQGQKIDLNMFFKGEKNLDVWANTSVLDPSFPEKLNALPVGDGIWHLETPKLTENLNIKTSGFTIYATDPSGNSINQQVKIVLKQSPKMANVTHSLSTDNELTLSWNYSKLVEQYLVEWNIYGESNVSQKVLNGNLTGTKINNLQSGTSYVVKVLILKKGEKGRVTELNVKTSGISPKSVIGTSSINNTLTTKTTPSIGNGVATTKRVAQTPKSDANVTPEATTSPTPSPTPSEKGAAAGGWSKLLVALSILIIAAGAALGGYYGYEWLMLRSKDKEDREPPESNSRW